MGDRINELKGRAKEAAGAISGDPDLEAEGRGEATVARGTRKVKGAANEAIGRVQEGLGAITGDDETEVRGRARRVSGDVQRAG